MPYYPPSGGGGGSPAILVETGSAEKVSAMTAASSVGASDLIPIVQGGVNKSATPGLLVGLQPPAVVSLTASQINHLSSSPATLIAAPGSGKAIVPIQTIFAYHFGTIPFGNNGQQINAVFNDTSSVAWDFGLFENSVSGVLPYPTFFTNSIAANFPPLEGQIKTFPYTTIGNAPLLLKSYNGDMIGFGKITASNLTSGQGGTGYASGDTGTILGSTGNTDAAYVVDTVGAGGAVLTYHLSNPGTGYGVSSANATSPGGSQPGIGSGFEIDITAISPGDGTGKVTILYSIISLP